MTRLAARCAAACVAVMATSPLMAAAIGTTFGKPHILGKVVPGEFEEAQRDLSGHFDQPLSLKVDPQSHPQEVMRIGLWLREQKPMLRIKSSCVGSCAWFMMDAGRSLEIDPDTVIAFSVQSELWAGIREQLERGDLSIDDMRSKASAADFMARVPAGVWDQAVALRDARVKQASAPAWVQQFVEDATRMKLSQLAHGDADFSLSLQLSPQRCLWWVPDEQGLRQLGLSPVRYRPVSAAAAAKTLGVPAGLIYVGPALREMPTQPLCEGGTPDKVPAPSVR